MVRLSLSLSSCAINCRNIESCKQTSKGNKSYFFKGTVTNVVFPSQLVFEACEMNGPKGHCPKLFVLFSFTHQLANFLFGCLLGTQQLPTIQKKNTHTHTHTHIQSQSKIYRCQNGHVKQKKITTTTTINEKACSI
jgi:hypothetical protein